MAKRIKIGDNPALDYIVTGFETVNGRKRLRLKCSRCGHKLTAETGNIKRKKVCESCEEIRTTETISEKPKAVKEDRNGTCTSICPEGEFEFMDSMVEAGSSINAASEVFVAAVRANADPTSPALVGLNAKTVSKRYERAVSPNVQSSTNVENSTLAVEPPIPLILSSEPTVQAPEQAVPVIPLVLPPKPPEPSIQLVDAWAACHAILAQTDPSTHGLNEVLTEIRNEVVEKLTDSPACKQELSAS